MRRHRRTIVFLTFLAGVALASILVARRVDPYATFVAEPNTPPGPDHVLGTDSLGRDVFARLVAGSLPTLVGSAVALATTLLGAGLLGGLSALAPAPIVRRLGDLMIHSLLSIPSLLVAMVLLTALNRSTISVAIAAGLGHVPLASVVFRDQIRLTSHSLHVTAARSLGAGPWRLLAVHILGVARPVLLAYAVTAFASNLLLMTSLSFLGFAGDIASPEWGSMIADGRAQLRAAPWAVVAPAIGVIVVASSMSVVARWLSRLE